MKHILLTIIVFQCLTAAIRSQLFFRGGSEPEHNISLIHGGLKPKWTGVKLTEKQKRLNRTITRRQLLRINAKLDGITRVKNISVNVLIVAYLRGGSTLVGSIIQQVPGIFHSHEPLRFALPQEFGPADYFSTKGICSFTSGVCRTSLKTINDQERAATLLRSFYECQLQNLPSGFVWGKLPISDEDIKYCIKHEMELCTAVRIRCSLSPARSIKTIRLSMDVVEDIIKITPNMKIIFLLRDPRGLLYSRMQLGFVNRKNQSERNKHIRGDCKRIQKDIEIYLDLIKLYPETLKAFLFEDIAETPYAASANLFKFIGLKPEKGFEQWLGARTSEGISSKDFETIRGNSKHIARQWRTALNVSDAYYVDGACQNVYKYMGLKPVENKVKMMDWAIPLRYKAPLFHDTKTGIETNE